MSKYTISIIILIYSFMNIHAQSEFTTKPNAFGFSFGTASFEHGIANSVGIGYSTNTFNLGFNYSWATKKEKDVYDDYTEKFKYYAFTPSCALYIFNEKENNIPFSLAIAGSYTYTFFTSDDLDYDNGKLTNKAIQLGFITHKKIDITESFKILPLFSYFYVSSTTELKYKNSGYSNYNYSKDSDATGFSLGIGFAYCPTETLSLVIRPSTSQSKNSSTESIAMLLILGFDSK
jgi:hypothetical protein